MANFEFIQTFHNGGNFEKDSWHNIHQAWINPPWPFLLQAVQKLRVDTPLQWVFVCPKYKANPAWYQLLHEADCIETFLLPRTLASGFFQRFRDNKPAEELPFPEWDVEIVTGTRASFL